VSFRGCPEFRISGLKTLDFSLPSLECTQNFVAPAISGIRHLYWENIVPIFDDPIDIRKVIYTTNAIESLNRSLRKVIKTKAVFPDEESVFKLMDLAMNNVAKRWTKPIKNWRAARSHFVILLPERFKI
jgi:putative transposase